MDLLNGYTQELLHTAIRKLFANGLKTLLAATTLNSKLRSQWLALLILIWKLIHCKEPSYTPWHPERLFLGTCVAPLRCTP